MWDNDLREKLINSEMQRSKEIKYSRELQEANEKLRKYNRTMQNNNNVLRKENANLKAELEETARCLDMATGSLDYIRPKIEEYERRIKDLTLENERLLKQKESMSNLISYAQAENSQKLIAENKRITQMHEAAMKVIEEQDSTIEKLSNGCLNAMDVIKQQDSDIDLMKRQIKVLREDKYEARDKAETWKQRAAHNASLNSHLHSVTRELREEIKHLRQKKAKRFLGL